MWSYDYTSTASKLADQCRVGVKLGAATSTTEVVALFNTVAKEKRCKCFFFDTGVEKFLASQFKALLGRPGYDRNGVYVGLTFSPDFPCHRSTKATAQQLSSFVGAMGIDAVDLLVIPWPSSTQEQRAPSDRGERKRDGALFMKTWKACQRMVDAGTVRALGVDNFVPWQLDFVISQAGSRPAANVLNVSVKHQQKVLASHSHARQVDVIANLDAAELGRNSRPSAQQESPLQDKEAGADSVGDGKGRDIHTPTPSEATCAPGSTECTEDRRLSVLRIAKDTDMTSRQVITSWCMHRGTVPLHTVASLSDGNSLSTQVAATAGSRRDSDGDGDLGGRVGEVFALLHPLASRPSFYSPNKNFHFDLAPQHVKTIESLDQDWPSTCTK